LVAVVPELAGALGAQQRGGQDIDGTTYLPDLPQAQAFNWQSGGDARGLDLTDETSALTTQQTPAVLLPEAKMLFVRNGVEVDRHGKKAGKGALIATEEAPTLDAGNHWALFQPQALDKGVAYDGYNQKLEVGVHRSLRIGRDSSDFVASKQTLEYGVRRLTPVECERLQAFPDGWTEPAVSDSARYKALGNAVTVNTVRWVLGRMLEQS
jgi:site-specific DNA-cytosine methylase